jgi:geranyl-CoA carboxylase alpha subunit
MFSKILVANRGEIARRVFKTARAFGYPTVAVYSDVDRDALHVRSADEAVHLPSGYLAIAEIVDAARRTGADAIHPGYGFLAENGDFARACRDAGLVFIGPEADVIDLMGDKARARARMSEAGVSVTPGCDSQDGGDDGLRRAAAEIGYPLLVKAVAGGGGRGMRRVDTAQDLDEALTICRSEAAGAFGRGDVFLERFLEDVRHVEVQIFGDQHGAVVHLGERDCSLQRRHQKVVEESPSPAVDDELRRRLGEAAVLVGRTVGYTNAGTVEFLLDKDGAFYFMEMNTRLQVEHPVTEMVTGLDLVAWQLRVAAGEPLPLAQDQISFTGHAMEARLYAEDPAAGFLPQPGRVLAFRPPKAAGVRVDHALADGSNVPADYDPMVAKVVAHGENREEARRRLLLALSDTVLLGPVTNRCFLTEALKHPRFVAGEVTTAFIGSEIEPRQAPPPSPTLLALAGVLLTVGAADDLTPWSSSGAFAWPVRLAWEGGGAELRVKPDVTAPRRYRVTLPGESDETVVLEILEATDDRVRFEAEGRQRTVAIVWDKDDLLMDDAGVCRRLAVGVREAAAQEGGDGRVTAPMTGRIKTVHAVAGASCEAGETLVVLEAMKLESPVKAPFAGTIEDVRVAVGDQVENRQLLAVVVASGG